MLTKGDEVLVQGIIFSSHGFNVADKPWRAKVVSKVKDEYNTWYKVSPIEKPPSYRKSPYIIHEKELKLINKRKFYEKVG